MKKFLASMLGFITASSLYANWNPIERNTYFEEMFQVSMEYDTYGTFLDTRGTIDALNCIGDFYETKYTFEEWQFIFNEGTDLTLAEYYEIENNCLLQALDLADIRLNSKRKL